ncbi:MAG TPA: PQQ-dependent sugar dehydrogenase [Pirellulales bacterium]|nr:PQQ-dependent sugar dehydrogenase [Pirellulales bacterium]
MNRSRDIVLCLSLVFCAAVAGCLGSQSASAADDRTTLLVDGLKNPESVCLGWKGQIYVTVIGEFDKNGDGEVVLVTGNSAKPFAKGLDDPKGIFFVKDALFVTDKQRVWRIDEKGQATVFAAADKFPTKPKFLNDICADDHGTLYVSDSGDLKGADGAVFRISTDGKATLVTDSSKAKGLKTPNGLLCDGPDKLLMLDFGSGELQQVNLADGKMVRQSTGYTGGDGLVRDKNGKLYISQWTSGEVSVLGRESHAPTQIGQFKAAADHCLDEAHDRLLVPDMTAGTLSAISLAGIPAVGLDEKPLGVKIERAFPNLDFNRPIVLTHPADGKNRVFVASQLGKVFVFPNKDDVSEASVYLDIESRVRYDEKENEEGFLGMAFHPKYKTNGEFFVYYTTTDTPHTSVISRFRVSKSDPNRADAKSEEEILRIPQPYWNHNGGTIVFGPDGYLYIGLGDGGYRDDPEGNGQNLGTLLGSILRIDVDKRDGDKAYSIPKDNPFVDQKGARGEIWAYGVRNIWRMAFDPQTKVLWAADVGQDIWEEIDLIVRGGNYGWNLREGNHKFGPNGSDARPDLIDPIYEYHHDVGKSITGGHVYRGKKVPELAGAYLYADYITGKVYALRYDAAKKQVTANHHIAGNVMPVFSFGEDEAGEAYFMTTQGFLHRFVSGKKTARGQ